MIYCLLRSTVCFLYFNSKESFMIIPMERFYIITLFCRKSLSSYLVSELCKIFFSFVFNLTKSFSLSILSLSLAVFIYMKRSSCDKNSDFGEGSLHQINILRKPVIHYIHLFMTTENQSITATWKLKKTPQKKCQA